MVSVHRIHDQHQWYWDVLGFQDPGRDSKKSNMVSLFGATPDQTAATANIL